MNRITSQGMADFEAFVKRVMDEGEAAGLAVAIVDRQGNTLYQKCFGQRNKAQGLPVDADTVFGLASVTKSFTCLAIMQLHEKGAIDVSQPVSRYLPYYNGRGVTVAQLMFHSGGYFPLPRILIGPLGQEMGLSQEKDGDFAFNQAIADEGALRVAKRLDSQTAFCGRPGENFSYCNDGYALLSAIVKDYGGQPSYSDYLAQNILAPLGMSRSCCDFLVEERMDNVSKLYKHSGDALQESCDFTDNAFALMGGGGMKSTLNDMKQYICMYLNRGKALSGSQIADGYTIDQMTLPRINNGLNAWYGYGLRMKPMDDLRIIEHGGSLTGVSSNMSFSYEADAGVMVLCNTSGVSVGLVADAAMKMLRGKAYDPNAAEYLPFTWSAEKLEAVCGQYKSGEGGETAISLKDGGLVLTQGGKDQPATPVSPYMLCIQGKFAKQLLRVWSDTNGKVWGLGLGSRIVPKA